MILWTLWRRRQLALELLEDYDRDNAPFDMDEALRVIREFGEAHAPPVNAGQKWREAARERMKDWPA